MNEYTYVCTHPLRDAYKQSQYPYFFFVLIIYCAMSEIAFMEELAERGYVVIPTGIDFVTYENGLDTWVQEVGGDDGIPTHLHGIFKHYGIGQTPFMRSIRKEEFIRGVFASVYGIDPDALTNAFDGACYLRATERKSRAWPHVDQQRSKQGFQCVQGLFSLSPMGENHGGLNVLAGSHLHHQRFKALGKGTGGFVRFSPREVKAYTEEARCAPVAVVANPGDLVIWDSRLVHWNAPPRRGFQARKCLYVSLSPDSFCTPAYRDKMQHYANTGRTTSHWTHCATVNSVMPQSYGDIQMQRKHQRFHDRGILYLKEHGITYYPPKRSPPRRKESSRKRRKVKGTGTEL
jgi:hypothetical protein